MEWAAVVGDAMHDVAAAEALWVLERCREKYLACFEVHKIQHDGRRAKVHGQSVHLTAIIVDSVLAPKYAIVDPNDGRLQGDVALQ